MHPHPHSMNCMIQPYVRHLNVERRLKDGRELSLLVRQFPHVEYLKLLFSFEKFSCLPCFQTLFSIDESTQAKRCLWEKLINFSIELFNNGFNQHSDVNDIHRWLIRNTHLKFIKQDFDFRFFNSILSIWF